MMWNEVYPNPPTRFSTPITITPMPCHSIMYPNTALLDHHTSEFKVIRINAIGLCSTIQIGMVVFTVELLRSTKGLPLGPKVATPNILEGPQLILHVIKRKPHRNDFLWVEVELHGVAVEDQLVGSWWFDPQLVLSNPSTCPPRQLSHKPTKGPTPYKLRENVIAFPDIDEVDYLFRRLGA